MAKQIEFDVVPTPAQAEGALVTSKASLPETKKERAKRLDRERHLRWKAKNPERVRLLQLARVRRHAATHREELRQSTQKWRDNNREKLDAHHAVAYAIRKGNLVRQPCWCGDTKSQAHHEDYTKKLEVVWLCQKHHKELHRKTNSL